MSDYYAVKRKAVARYDIPPSLAREIGRFLVTWAHFEHYVQSVIWSALDVSEVEGRIAVREPRVTDRLDMLRDLGAHQGMEMDYVLLKEIKVKSEPLASKRHLLAHSIWQKLDDDWCVIVTRGLWPELGVEIADYPAGSSKNAEPEAIPVSVADVRQWTESSIGLINDLKNLGKQHRLVPLPEKQKKRSAPEGQNHSRKGSKHKSPRPTSQG
jgi:hypothetical protein